MRSRDYLWPPAIHSSSVLHKQTCARRSPAKYYARDRVDALPSFGFRTPSPSSRLHQLSSTSAPDFACAVSSTAYVETATATSRGKGILGRGVTPLAAEVGWNVTPLLHPFFDSGGA